MHIDSRLQGHQDLQPGDSQSTLSVRLGRSQVLLPVQPVVSVASLSNCYA